MSFGENKKARIAELEKRIEHLEMVNGALCAEINRQERVIEQLREKEAAYMDGTRMKGMEMVSGEMVSLMADDYRWHLMAAAKRIEELESLPRKAYVVDTWSDLDDIGEHYVERRVYRTREAAERRAEQVSGCDDGVRSYAAVYEFEVVDE